MKELIIKQLSKHTDLNKQQLSEALETPPSLELGDYAFPCFSLSKKLRQSPNEIAKSLAKKIKSKEFEKVEAKGPYINFFLDRKKIVSQTLRKILKEKDKFGSSKIGKGKKMIIDMSSPNIAKPFGVGHLRSTIIGNAITNIYAFSGYKTIKVNYLGDWGTPLGKILAGYQSFGNEKKLKEHPLKQLYEIYVLVNNDPKFEEIGRKYFKKLESGDKKLLSQWKKFRDLSVKDFKKIYTLLGIKFDVYTGESAYNKKMELIIRELEKKKLLERSDNALIVNLDKYNLGVGLIQKTDGTTLYLTRDIALAKDRYKKYKFDKNFYEVGSEQKLHFKQLFKTLELMGYKWAKNCFHIDHGLYLGEDGKKLATREGKTIFMEHILEEVLELAKKEIQKREVLSEKELHLRALAITRAAIIYGDLRNYRTNDVIFNINKFLSFEGNTGPYLLYTYARARNILRKANYKGMSGISIKEPSNLEKDLVFQLAAFPEVVEKARESLASNLIANYSFQIAQKFNEFYHDAKVIGSKEEGFRLALVDAFSQVLKNSLFLLGIQTIEKM